MQPLKVYIEYLIYLMCTLRNEDVQIRCVDVHNAFYSLVAVYGCESLVHSMCTSGRLNVRIVQFLSCACTHSCFDDVHIERSRCTLKKVYTTCDCAHPERL
jgi:hypothetical protein